MSQDLGFIAFEGNSEPASDFGFIEGPVSSPVRRAKGIGEEKRSEAEVRRSQQAVEQLYKGLGLGALKTLAATSGADFQRRPQLHSAFEELLGIEEPATPEQKITRRVAETAGGLPFLGILGAEGAIPLLGGSLAGGATEEITGSPLAGDITDLVVSLGAGTLPGGARFSKGFEKTAERARRLGFTDKELAALSHGKRKQTFLARHASKGSKAEKLSQKINNAFDTAYDQLGSEAASLGPLTSSQEDSLAKSVGSVLDDLKKTVKPSVDKEAAIKYIDESLTELFQKGATPEELINWYQDVNSTINWKAIRGGKKKLASIKEPILDALQSSSPELANDFRAINELYGRSQNLYRTLKPTSIEGFLNEIQLPAAAFGILTGHPGVLYETFGRIGAKRISHEFLTNPNLQGLQRKLISAIRNGRLQQARKLSERIQTILDKTGVSPESQEEEIQFQESSGS